MADFEIAHKRVAIFEGGYQCMPQDNGNWTGGKKNVGKLIGTKYGISAPVLKEYLGKEPTSFDMLNLSVETSHKIYKKNYWDKVWGDKIESQNIANQIYDNAVNAGVGEAIRQICRVYEIPERTSMSEDILKKLNNK